MKSKLLLVAGTLILGAAALSAPAEAKVRLMVNAWGVPYFQTYYPPYAPHWRRRVPPPDVYDSSYYDDYGADSFDESYYDPYYLPPSERPLKLKPRKPVVAKSKVKPQAVQTLAVKPKSTATGSSTASLTKTSAPATSSSKLSCDKAGKIIEGYGFGGVTSKDCQGQVYEFSATRDGKNFLIKLSAASGDLTDVRKVD